MTDFTLTDHGTIAILYPDSDEARDWVSEYLPGTHFGGGIVIEHRYVGPIVEGIWADGLSIGE